MGLVAGIIAALIAAVMTVHPTIASAATTCPAGRICGTTKLTGSKTGVVRVRLSAPAQLDMEHVGLSGSGRVVGVAVVADRPGFDGPMAYYVRASGSAAPGGSYGSGFWTSRGFEESGWLATLPAGPYRLYLIADGKPVTATLRFVGAPGSVTMTTTPIDGYAVRTVRFTKTTTGPTTTFAGAVSHQLTRTGIMATYAYAEVESNAAGVFGLCRWTTTAPPEAASQPGCPGAMVSAYPVAGNIIASFRSVPMAAGPYAYGSYLTTDGSLVRISQVAFWMEFR